MSARMKAWLFTLLALALAFAGPGEGIWPP